MKSIKAILALCLLTTLVAQAAELTEADQKWSKAADKKIAAGPATISTPSETRAKLAAQLAAKYGRTCKLAKTETGYTVTVEGGNTTLVAKTSND